MVQVVLVARSAWDVVNHPPSSPSFSPCLEFSQCVRACGPNKEIKMKFLVLFSVLLFTTGATDTGAFELAEHEELPSLDELAAQLAAKKANSTTPSTVEVKTTVMSSTVSNSNLTDSNVSSAYQMLIMNLALFVMIIL